MKKLLFVFAHPDDVFLLCPGTISKYAEAGWEVDLMCATGQHQKEFQQAAEVLSIHSITFLGYQAGALMDQTPGEIEDKVYQKIMEFIPDCIITTETKGINNDPDHIRLSFATTFAFQKYAAWIEEKLKDQEMAQQNFPTLYYACLPASVVEFLKKEKKLSGESFGKPRRGIADKSVTTVIDVSDFVGIKTEVQSAYNIHEESGYPFLEQEYYVLRMHGTTEVFMGKHDAVSHEL